MLHLFPCAYRCHCDIRVAYEIDEFDYVVNASHPVEQFDDRPLGTPPEVCDFIEAEHCDDLCLWDGDDLFYEIQFNQSHPRVNLLHNYNSNSCHMTLLTL